MPTKFTQIGFNTMTKIINESGGFPKQPQLFNLDLNKFKLSDSDTGYTHLSLLQHTYTFFIYNIHFRICI